MKTAKIAKFKRNRHHKCENRVLLQSCAQKQVSMHTFVVHAPQLSAWSVNRTKNETPIFFQTREFLLYTWADKQHHSLPPVVVNLKRLESYTGLGQLSVPRDDSGASFQGARSSLEALSSPPGVLAQKWPEMQSWNGGVIPQFFDFLNDTAFLVPAHNRNPLLFRCFVFPEQMDANTLHKESLPFEFLSSFLAAKS